MRWPTQTGGSGAAASRAVGHRHAAGRRLGGTWRSIASRSSRSTGVVYRCARISCAPTAERAMMPRRAGAPVALFTNAYRRAAFTRTWCRCRRTTAARARNQYWSARPSTGHLTCSRRSGKTAISLLERTVGRHDQLPQTSLDVLPRRNVHGANHAPFTRIRRMGEEASGQRGRSLRSPATAWIDSLGSTPFSPHESAGCHVPPSCRTISGRFARRPTASCGAA
jgi:hypothetical protein